MHRESERTAIQGDYSDPRHGIEWWRDDYGEWVWTCSCTPEIHGGYASESSATREAKAHRHDCGHTCCDERRDPMHDHFLAADNCPSCVSGTP